LTRSRDALVHDEPGVTRDRNYGVCRLDPERPFVLVDTGGIAGSEEGLAGATARQSRAAAEEADLILFIVDGREGASSDRRRDPRVAAQGRHADRSWSSTRSTAWIRRTALAEFAALRLQGRARHVRLAQDRHRHAAARALESLPEGLATAEILDDDPERMRVAFVGRPERPASRRWSTASSARNG
jgi:GTP-binding protein